MSAFSGQQTDSSPNDSDIFPGISQAVLLAARATRLVLEQDFEGDRWSKEDRTPVTVADLASQAILLGELARSAPGEMVLAEEETVSLEDSEKASRVREIVEETLGVSVSIGEIRDRIGYRGDSTSEARWFVDPLDGTKGFVKGLVYAVAIARMVKGELDCSWLAVPGREDLMPGTAGQLFRAVRGGGSYARPLRENAPERRLQLDCGVPDGEIIVVVSRAHDSSKGPGRLARAGIPTKPLPFDSQAKYAVLATGNAHLYPRRPSGSFGPNYCWDHAPGALLLEEAGGKVTDLTGRPLDYTHGERLVENRGILAAINEELHSKTLAVLRADYE